MRTLLVAVLFGIWIVEGTLAGIAEREKDLDGTLLDVRMSRSKRDVSMDGSEHRLTDALLRPKKRSVERPKLYIENVLNRPKKRSIESPKLYRESELNRPKKRSVERPKLYIESELLKPKK